MKCKYCGKERRKTHHLWYLRHCEHCGRPDAADDSDEMAMITERNKNEGKI